MATQFVLRLENFKLNCFIWLLQAFTQCLLDCLGCLTWSPHTSVTWSLTCDPVSNRLCFHWPWFTSATFAALRLLATQLVAYPGWWPRPQVAQNGLSIDVALNEFIQSDFIEFIESVLDALVIRGRRVVREAHGAASPERSNYFIIQ